MSQEIATVGVYGFSQDTFLDSLLKAGVTALCDVRARRGVRGRAYAFANSTALQRSLKERGIVYVHRKDLAPSEQTRDIQKQMDKAHGVLKRERLSLSTEFIRQYEDERLASFDATAFLRSLPGGTIALLCVEKEPSACHRSLIAECLARKAGASVKHICA